MMLNHVAYNFAQTRVVAVASDVLGSAEVGGVILAGLGNSFFFTVRGFT